MQKALTFQFGEEGDYRAVFPLSPGDFTLRIGRPCADCDVPVPPDCPGSETVSRSHIRLCRYRGQFWVEDLASRNLTWVDGTVLLAPRQVMLPCELQLGTVRLCIEEANCEDGVADRLQASWYDAFAAEESAFRTATMGAVDWRAALGDASEAVRQSATIIESAEALTRGTQPARAHSLLERILAIHLGAERVCLEIDAGLDRLPRQIGALRITERERDKLRSMSDESELCRVLNPSGRRILWVLRSPHETRPSVTVAVGRFPEDAYEAAASDVTHQTMGVVLRLASFAMRNLRKLQSLQAQQATRPNFEPSEDTLRICQEIGLWGVSPAMRECMYMAERAARTYLPLNLGDRTGLKVICLKGEIGTGKTALAKLIHRLSDRSTRPFVHASVGAMTESLVESQFFGIRKGSASGVTEDRPGWFAAAAAGTLFIDDINHVPLPIQRKLLTTLSEGVYIRVGDSVNSTTDAHVVVASNQDLDRLAADGLFLKDLKSRLDTLTIAVPPLRARREDIPLIVERFLTGLCEANEDCHIERLSEEVESAFLRHDWPDNVRELLAVIQAGVVMGLAVPGKRTLEWEDLPADRRNRFIGARTAHIPLHCDIARTLNENYEALDREYVVRLLRKYEGRFEQAAKHSGSRGTFADREKKLRGYLADAPAAEVAWFKELAGEGWFRIDPNAQQVE